MIDSDTESCEQRVRSLFDQKAGAWSEKYSGFFRHRLSLFQSAVHRYVTRGSRILDFGCGTGDYVGMLAHDGYFMVGVDLSAQMISIADQRFAKEELPIVFHVGTLQSLSTDLKHFDAVIASSVFEYLDDPERELRVLKASVRPSGFLLLTVPNFDSRRKRWERSVRRWRRILRLMAWSNRLRRFLDYLDLSRNHYLPEQFAELAQASGWRVEAWQYFNPLNGQQSTDDVAGGEMLFFVLQNSPSVE